jgi:hypothetical protein
MSKKKDRTILQWEKKSTVKAQTEKETNHFVIDCCRIKQRSLDFSL